MKRAKVRVVCCVATSRFETLIGTKPRQQLLELPAAMDVAGSIYRASQFKAKKTTIGES